MGKLKLEPQHLKFEPDDVFYRLIEEKERSKDPMSPGISSDKLFGSIQISTFRAKDTPQALLSELPRSTDGYGLIYPRKLNGIASISFQDIVQINDLHKNRFWKIEPTVELLNPLSDDDQFNNKWALNHVILAIVPRSHMFSSNQFPEDFHDIVKSIAGHLEIRHMPRKLHKNDR